MGFRNNSKLVSSAIVHNIAADGDADTIDGTADHSDIFIFAPGTTGDDTILGFNKNDSLVSDKMIFDGNRDGIITLGNEVLDLDRTGGGAKNAGADQISLVRDDNSLITDLRYLGTKIVKDAPSQYVYADAEVRFALEKDNGTSVVKEGLVSNDTGLSALSGAGKNFDFLYDTALGLNLGSDTITDFTFGDRLVTTVEIFDGNGDNKITFGGNGVLDLAGEDATGGDVGPGGQIKFEGVNQLAFLETKQIGGVDYYFYGVDVVPVI